MALLLLHVQLPAPGIKEEDRMKRTKPRFGLLGPVLFFRAKLHKSIFTNGDLSWTTLTHW